MATPNRLSQYSTPLQRVRLETDMQLKYMVNIGSQWDQGGTCSGLEWQQWVAGSIPGWNLFAAYVFERWWYRPPLLMWPLHSTRPTWSHKRSGLSSVGLFFLYTDVVLVRSVPLLAACITRGTFSSRGSIPGDCHILNLDSQFRSFQWSLL